MSGDMYDWERCDHKGIGNIGCPTCDPDKGRVMIRQQRLDNRDLRARLAQAEKELDATRLVAQEWSDAATKAEADAAALRNALDRLVTSNDMDEEDSAFRLSRVRDARALLASPSPGAGWVSPEVAAEARSILLGPPRDPEIEAQVVPSAQERIDAALAKLTKGGG